MKINGSGVGEINYTPPYSTGLLRPPHAKRFGITVSLFMAFEDRVTDGQGTDGFVFGGAPVLDEDFAKDFGVHAKSVAATRRKLERWGYIQTKRAKGGAYTVVVRKSKKWELLKRLRKNESAPAGSESAPNRSEYALAEGLLPIDDKVVTREGQSLVAQELVQFWNENKGGLPEIKTFTKTRKAKLTTRLKENPNFLADLKSALIKARASKFLLSWRPSVDWFLENDNNIVKTLEGKYDNRGEKDETLSAAGNTGRRGSERASKAAGTLRESTHYKPTPSVL